MTQPLSRATNCQSKACHSWNILRKISPYKLPDRPVCQYFADVICEWSLPKFAVSVTEIADKLSAAEERLKPVQERLAAVERREEDLKVGSFICP